MTGNVAVYLHRRLDTDEVFYVGIGVNNRAFRKSKRSDYWWAIVNKHGYRIEVTHTDLIWEEAASIERYLIVFYGRHDLGLGSLVNLTDGGEGSYGFRHTEESKRKISEIKKKLYAENPDAHASKGRLGPLSGFYGKKHTEESIEKIRQRFKGEGAPWWGKSPPNAKKVINTQTGEVFDSIRKAALSIGYFDHKQLSGMLNGSRTNKTPFRFYEQQTTDKDEANKIV